MRPLIYALIIAGIAMVFALQNAAEIDVQFLVWDIQMSQALLIILTLIIGVIIGLLAATKSIWHKRSELKKQKKEIAALQKELETIKNKAVTVPTQIPPTSNPQPPVTPV